MLSRTWKFHPKPLLPEGFVEDPVLHRDASGVLWLYHTSGPSFQNQRIFRCRAETPFGPFDPPELVHETGAHTRLYRGRIDADAQLVSAVWPGLPKCGIWVFEQMPYGEAKSLVVEPKDGTLYSVAAANPCVRYDAKNDEYDILFEGRDERVFWRIFHARWKPGTPAVVDPTPWCEGANPSIFEENGVRYLVFSQEGPNRRFVTRIMTQKAEP